jgi:hypothetical protein
MFDSNRVWVGLDLGQESTNVCIVNDMGEVLLEQVCRTSLPELEAALSPFPLTRVGLISVEAGSETHVIRKLLYRG